ncbi:MAG TPA: MarR family transcriptional regulator [Candidatus Hydrogenedentes bacterium]|nr:MarR family transcriptional regulator [Candidatus Hydrogenedentota bacterium]HOT50577.1 MarR family transcriptional regulator [Candidatus Hydrogenedentota bacterium]HOV72907.1 MarR family transcriptional regulator [Candidatus Hydrogenedentota bacterium]HPC18223.1 MarR family transcriptional regulator [Candidatus Hydrogenedentota bacterium]HRT21874.1 MarR family transcriptional regulator [Candidatus Hydrogenedentota bacterium]
MSLAAELHLDRPFSDLRHETLLNIVHTAGLFSAVGEALFRPFGLTQAQFNVLFALKYKIGPITQAGLGKRLVVSRASITSVLDKLERKQLVVRESVSGNRRIYHVSLTAKGRAMIEQVEPLYRERIHAALADLSDAECVNVIRYMERMRAQTAKMRGGA